VDFANGDVLALNGWRWCVFTKMPVWVTCVARQRDYRFPVSSTPLWVALLWPELVVRENFCRRFPHTDSPEKFLVRRAHGAMPHSAVACYSLPMLANQRFPPATFLRF
jgi:hypothetical protein